MFNRQRYIEVRRESGQAADNLAETRTEKGAEGAVQKTPVPCHPAFPSSGSLSSAHLLPLAVGSGTARKWAEFRAFKLAEDQGLFYQEGESWSYIGGVSGARVGVGHPD